MDEQRSEQHLNIHFSPELMAGVYANHVSVRRSDFEFSVDFARRDVGSSTAIGVARVNITPRFALELMGAVEDNHGNWDFRERVRSLPEASLADKDDEEERRIESALYEWAMGVPTALSPVEIRWKPRLATGVYANFANVSHSEYEFTVTFVRLDYEVEVDEIPGVVVCRVNLAARFVPHLRDELAREIAAWRAEFDA